MNGSIAIFVKTPGLSPIKTRLAKAIGRDQAEAFHIASASAVSAIVLHASKSLGTRGYFAVAEIEGMASPLWQSQEQVYQGIGNLGQRLHHVYSQLQEKHGYAFLLGADAPQLEVNDFHLAAASLKNQHEPSFVLGPAKDGGFWLLGGNRPLPDWLWTSVEYSQVNTGKEIKALLAQFGSVHELRELADVDEVEDIFRLKRALEMLVNPLPEQENLRSLLIGLNQYPYSGQV